ncbi:MAG: hypothetical protein Kow0058_12190 [Roseovarius sp.]
MPAERNDNNPPHGGSGMGFFAGLDWGGASHALCVIDAGGGAVVDRAGLPAMLRRLARIAAPAELPLAIERPSGLIVHVLVEAGHPVVPIHPNAVRAARPRYPAAGGKDDRGDAYLLADLLRTDGHRFRPLSPLSDEMRALRALVRGRDDLAAEAGLCPVTHQSGKSRGVGFRWACNRRLRKALTCVADNSRHASAWAADVYAKARARGCRHPRAICILGRAWVRILWRAWTDGTRYDPAIHNAAAAMG